MDNTQLTLPYFEIKELANRDFLRENFTRSSKEVYKIPFNSLLIREGFNKRIVYNDIEALADSIAAKGLETPLDVDVLPDGRVFIEKGHKRYKAICFNRDRGIIMDFVDCYPNNKNKTELERMMDIYSSNMYSSKLNSVEQAGVISDLKNNFGKISSEEIGKRLGISRQQVDNLLLIAAADDGTKQEMLNGNLGITEAIKYLRSIKTAKKQSDKVEEDSHKNSAPPTPFPKDELASEMKELDELDKQAEEFKNNDEEPEEVRLVNPVVQLHKTKELDLVGNKIAINGKEKNDDDGTVKYDESRPEIEKIQKAIQVGDKIESIVNKLDVPEGTKKDIAYQVHWLIENLMFVREWVHSNKKQNKSR